MSLLDEMMAAGGDDVLSDVHATEKAVTIYGPQAIELTAIVGKLRVERAVTGFGQVERVTFLERCKASIRDAPPEAIAVDASVRVAQYTRGDASVDEGERFIVDSITGQRGPWTHVELARPLLARVHAQGTEAR
ncbi:MAG: hypothetical protein AB7G28_22765 [Pirellulales bacterium]